MGFHVLYITVTQRLVLQNERTVKHDGSNNWGRIREGKGWWIYDDCWTRAPELFRVIAVETLKYYFVADNIPTDTRARERNARNMALVRLPLCDKTHKIRTKYVIQ